MSETSAQIVDLGFQVADGEGIKVAYDDKQALQVSFKDWQEKSISFICHDTIAFRWQQAAYYLSDQERFDSSHEIIHSPWLQLHEKQGETWNGTTFHHYKLNFNAAGILEVICSSIKRLPEQGAAVAPAPIV